MGFWYSKSMANSEVFRQNFSSSTNPKIMRSAISYLQWFLSTFFPCNFFALFFGNVNTIFFIGCFAIFLGCFFTLLNIFWFAHWFLLFKMTIFFRNFDHDFFRFPGFTFLANSFTISSCYGFVYCPTFFGPFRSAYFFWYLQFT